MLKVLAKLTSEKGTIVGYRLQDIERMQTIDMALAPAVQFAQMKQVLGCKTYRTEDGRELLIGDGGPNNVVMSQVQSLSVDREHNKPSKGLLEVVGIVTFGINALTLNGLTGDTVGYSILNVSDTKIDIERSFYKMDDRSFYIKEGRAVTTLNPNESLLISRADLKIISDKYTSNKTVLFTNGKVVRGSEGSNDTDEEKLAKCYFAFSKEYKDNVLNITIGNKRYSAETNITDSDVYARSKEFRVKNDAELLKIFGYCNNASLKLRERDARIEAKRRADTKSAVKQIESKPTIKGLMDSFKR